MELLVNELNNKIGDRLRLCASCKWLAWRRHVFYCSKVSNDKTLHEVHPFRDACYMYEKIIPKGG